ncbi:MAG: outer membrane lipid asymmetry maintenance protein MlaD [Rhodobacteraceae bacterium]|jgi:phospholipid/cholesterol/gamma-HCH transport system substrate-binding protein|uniref:Phospholipid/cholesterol/gamma-HCH transport system substrate-binding protein n=1 Tax=Salipiger profundus TaxID=1229727 RepID=A0A1U7D103_9RHOB|nr:MULTISPECIES: outer membrane lipid asymmetry maintenance protein MlaD [Salipiger]APX21812.1 phospholipid/cholesterol/gamma-HCH transport system substrate-binding protein [Salipiger profundus]MAB07995.1 outer membrane lipid asymmetry maintenance protein MlaD [Paracoccaceae bacterium]GGA05471.1 outer membrane lipid asymmetry maintenance protein MlaD [Salipiger profundus]SFC33099.1 phospholipid/cholesterol/gamma-HCH transport system substrate-binding protein [Salipiger profundus]
MTTSATEVLVGGAVLAAAIAFGAYTVTSTGFSFGESGYPLSASFRSLEGVTVGSDVRLAGVKIGTVTDIALNAETYRADMALRMNDGVQIPDDSAIVISSEGLLGGNFVEISPGGSMFYYEAGDEILDTQGSVSLISLLLKYVSGGSGE